MPSTASWSSRTRRPTVRMGKATIELPIGSFLQATEAAESTLAALVVDALAGHKAVADLFSGAGPFALRLAETARVAAFDSDKPAIIAHGKGRAQHAGAEAGDRKTPRPLPRSARRDRAQGFRRRRLRSPARRRRSAGPRARAIKTQDHRRRELRAEDLCARCKDPHRRRLQARPRHPGRSVRLLDPCGNRRGVPALDDLVRQAHHEVYRSRLSKVPAAQFKPATKHAELGDTFYDPVAPAIFPQHILRYRNQRWANRVGLGDLTEDAVDRPFRPLPPAPRLVRKAAGAALSRPPVPVLQPRPRRRPRLPLRPRL